jgi:flagellar motor protein MotB
MPDLSASNKSMLTTAVERARGMYKLSIINFGSGGVAPSSAAITQLVEGLHSPDVQKLLGDPTAVIIILGYADTQGNPDANLKISQQRAKSLEKALSIQGKIKNAMHAVGMGSSEMFGEKQREKNRVVEIWAVLP